MIDNFPDKVFLLAVVTNKIVVEPNFRYGVACFWLPWNVISVLHKESCSKCTSIDRQEWDLSIQILTKIILINRQKIYFYSDIDKMYINR